MEPFLLKDSDMTLEQKVGQMLLLGFHRRQLAARESNKFSPD